MLKVVDEQAAYEQWAGFDRPYRLRLYRAPAGPPVVVATAEPFTTWLVRYGPDLAAHVCARHGLDPCAVRWINEVPAYDPADPDLDPAVVEALTVGAGYTYCTFAPQPGAPGRLRYQACAPVTRAWVEATLLGCALDDGGVNPPADSGLRDRAARLVRGPAGDGLRALGLLTVPPTLAAAGTSATPVSSPIAAPAARHRRWRRRRRAGDGAR